MINTRTLSSLLLAVVCSSLLLAGCAPATRPVGETLVSPRTWPEPPATPRIRFESSFHAAEDLGIEKSFWRRLGEFITGADTTWMIRPMAVVTDPDGKRIHVADPGIRGVHRFDLENHRYKIIRRENNRPLPSPTGITRDVDGRIYVTDSVLATLFVLEPDGKFFTPVKLEVDLIQPTGIVSDPATGSLYIVDTGAHDIKVFSTNGKLLRQFGARGSGPSAFNFPTGIWLNADGHLLVTDSLNFRIQVLDTEGHFITRFGQAGDASGTLARPKGVATDSFGHIYVVDSIHHALQIFDLDGNLLLELGEQGHGAGQFWLPTGIFIAPDNRIYVSDSHNQRVQIFRYIGGKP